MVESGAPVADAGHAILSAGRSSTFEILREIRRYGDPDDWFLGKAIEGLAQRKIRPGRETKPSPRADAFFHQLGDGEVGKAYWRAELARREGIHLDKLDRQRKVAGVGRSEALDYWIYASKLWNKR